MLGVDDVVGRMDGRQLLCKACEIHKDEVASHDGSAVQSGQCVRVPLVDDC